MSTISTSRNRSQIASVLAIITGLLLLFVATATAIDSGEPIIRKRPSAELPREWRWEKPVVVYDHMFMDPRHVNNLDWIRDGSR